MMSSESNEAQKQKPSMQLTISAFCDMVSFFGEQFFVLMVSLFIDRDVTLM